MISFTTVSVIQEWIDRYAPRELAAQWDNVGLQIGDPESQVKKILVALDPLAEVIQEASNLNCDLVITHHPLFFKPISYIRFNQPTGTIVLSAITNKISIMAAHTNLDAAPGGVSDTLASLIGLKNIKRLSELNIDFKNSDLASICRIGEFLHPITIHTLTSLLKDKLGLTFLRLIAADPSSLIKKVVVCGGSGAKAIPLANLIDFDALITGDIKYHDARLALEMKLVVFDVGHFNSEHVIIQKLAEYLKKEAKKNHVDIEIFVSLKEKDPFMTV